MTAEPLASVWRSTLRILYTNWEGHTGYRDIHPIALHFERSEFHGTEFVWLLRAWATDRSALRHFKIDDIQSLELLERGADEPLLTHLLLLLPKTCALKGI